MSSASKNKMKAIFESDLYWTKYNSYVTMAKNYFSDKSKCGGPLTEPLYIGDPASSLALRTPLLQLMEGKPTFGFYEILGLKDGRRISNKRYDLWILSTDERRDK